MSVGSPGMTVANQASAAAADGDHQQALLAAGMGGSVGGIGAEGAAQGCKAGADGGPADEGDAMEIDDVPVPSGFVNHLETVHKAIDGQLDKVKKPDTSAVKRVQTATDQLGECFYLQAEYSDRIEEAATRMAELEGQVNAVKGQVEAAVAAGNSTDVVLGEFFRLNSSIKAAAEECVKFRVLLQSQVVKQQQLEGLIDRLIEFAIHTQQGRLTVAVGKLYEKVETWVGCYQVPKYWQGADLVTLQSVMAAKIRAKIKAAADGVVLFMDTQYAKAVEQQAMLS